MNMTKMLQQAQKMQKKMQEEMQALRVDGVAASGKVKVTINGEKAIQAVKLDPSVVDPKDVETLEDLLLVAFRDACDKADAALKEQLGGLTGGLGIPGLF